MNCDKCEHNYEPTEDEINSIFLQRGIFGEISVHVGEYPEKDVSFRDSEHEITIAFTPHNGPTIRRCYYKEEAIRLANEILEKANSIEF